MKMDIWLIKNACHKMKTKYSWMSPKRLPKMSSLGGRLQEVAAYESLDHV